jgi:hypothetical protein
MYHYEERIAEVKTHAHCGGEIKSVRYEWQKPRDRLYWHATDRNGNQQGPWRYRRAAEQWVERQHGHSVYTQQYQQMLACSSTMAETNDCTVIAVATACGVPYHTAHDALKRRGRVEGQGTYDYQYIGACRDLGYVVTEVRDERIKTVKTIDRVLSRGSYIVQVKRHALAVVDGKVHDHTRGRAMPVKRVWRVERAAI